MTIHSVAATPQATPKTDKRERILRAAVTVFARTGYFNAKVSEVAKGAGVADGTIYLYFSGKEDLLVSIFRDTMERFMSLLRDVLERETDPAKRLAIIIRSHLENLGTDRDLAVVFQVELRQSLKFMELFSKHELADYLELLRGVIEEGQRDGSFRSDLRPHFIVKSIFGMLDEMVTSWILSDKDHRPIEEADSIVALLLHGLRPDGKP